MLRFTLQASSDDSSEGKPHIYTLASPVFMHCPLKEQIMMIVNLLTSFLTSLDAVVREKSCKTLLTFPKTFVNFSTSFELNCFVEAVVTCRADDTTSSADDKSVTFVCRTGKGSQGQDLLPYLLVY